MADIITLAQFDFDSDRLEKGIEQLQKQLFELTKRQQELNNQSKEVNKALAAQTKESERLVQTFKNESKEYQNIIQQQAKLKKAGQENTQEYRNLNTEKQRVIASFKEESREYQTANQNVTNLTNRQESLFLSTKDLQIQRGVLNKEYQTATTLYKQFIGVNGEVLSLQEVVNQSVKQEVVTREQAKAVNQQLNRIKDQLNVTNETEKQLLDEINQRIDANNKLLVESGSQNEQRTANIGKYSESIKEAAGDLDIFNGGLGNFIQKSQEAGGAGNLIGNSLKTVASGFVGATKASLAFIATPIGAFLAILTAAFLLVRNALSRSEESTNKLKAAFTPLTGIFKAVLKALEPLGEFIIDGIVKGFDLATEAIQSTVKTIGAALKSLGFDSASESVFKFSQSMDDAINSSRELALAEKNLEDAQRKSRLTQLQYQKEAENFRQIRDDESLTIQQRIKANEQLGVVLNKQLQEEKRLAQVALQVAELRLLQEGETKEALDAQYAALTQIADIEERINGQRSEQLTNINSLRREAQAQAKSAHDERMKQIDAQIAKQKEQLELWIAEQGDRARTLQDELNLQEQTAKKSLAILDNELKNKKISREKYDLEVLKLSQETAKLQAQIAVQIAEDNLDTYIYENQERLKQGQLLTDDLLTQEIDRNKALQSERDAFARLQFEQGLINQRELNQTLLANEREYLETEKELRAQNAADNREIQNVLRAEEFEVQLIQLQENLASEFEIRKAQADFEYEDQRLTLEQQRADGLITEEMYQAQLDNITATHALVRKQIEQDVQKAKLDITKDVFSGIAELVGEQTAMGKAAGIATATINTYQGVSEVWKSPSVFPEPYNTILKAVQTGITVASGLKTVKQISAVKTPSVKGYATGGIISGGFGIKRSNGDDVLITAKRGEAILNERQQSIIGTDLLSLAGVPGFATGGMVGSASASVVQNSLQKNNFDMDMFMQRIEVAVQNGSENGSYNGSQSGSQQGISQLSSNRAMQATSYI